MMSEGTLRPGMIIRYDRALWRVEHCNPSRAYIIPLTKRQVMLGDRSFEASERGVSIGANSYVEVVEDLERARTELELAAAERELAAARAALEKTTMPAMSTATTLTPTTTTTPRQAVRPPRCHWRLAGPTPTVASGSLKAAVLAFLAAHPGAATADVAAGCPAATPGAVAACLDRFRKAGVVKEG